jgi:hypothetical protein
MKTIQEVVEGTIRKTPFLHWQELFYQRFQRL